MDDTAIKREIALMLMHYLQQRTPDVATEFGKFCDTHALVENGYSSIEEALETRYKHFPDDQFFEFLKTLRPPDDYPSIFRRITPFERPTKDIPISNFVRSCQVFGHTNAIYCMIKDPCSTVLITASDDYYIKLWTIPTLQPIAILSGHTNVITNINANPFWTVLASSSSDKTIRLWSLQTCECLAVLVGFTQSDIHSVVFSPSGSVIAAACEDGTIPIWTTQDALQSLPPCHQLFSHNKSPISWVSFSPGGELLAFAAEAVGISVIALKTLTSFPFEQVPGNISYINFSSSFFQNQNECAPRLYGIAGEDGIVTIWQLDNATWRSKLTFKHTGNGRRSTRITRAVFDKEEHLLILAKTNMVLVCDAFTGATIGSLPTVCQATLGASVLVQNPKYPEVFFIANGSGAAAIANVVTLRILGEARAPDDTAFTEGVWSDDGRWVFASDTHGSIAAFHVVLSGETYKRRFESREAFWPDELKLKGTGIVDRKGKPTSTEIAPLHNLEVKLRQAPFLRATAIELKLIQHLVTSDRVTVTPSASAIIVAPPQHIKITHEYPVNPHGEVFVPPQIVEGEEDAESNVQIVSDDEDWDFEEQTDPQETYIEPPAPAMILSQEAPPGLYPNYLIMTNYEDSVYIPQVGDEVMLLKEGYARVCASNGSDFAAVENLPVTSLHSVRVIEPIPTGLKISLGNRENDQVIILIYPIPEESNFLVLVQKYRKHMEIMKSVSVGDNVVIPYNEDGNIVNYPAEITAIRDDWNDNPFESIIVHFSTDENSPISPWDFSVHNGKPIHFLDPAAYISSVSASFLKIVDSVAGDPGNEIFSTIDQTGIMSYPISINIIKQRIENGFYRSFKSIAFDTGQLKNGAIQKYGADSPEAGRAKNMSDSITANIRALGSTLYERQKQKKAQLAQKQQNEKQ